MLPDDVTLINDNTYQQRADLDTGFTIGTNSPSTLSFRVRASDIDYTGDSPEDFVPRTGAEAIVTWQLRFSPVLSSIVAAGYEYQNADDDANTEINNTEFDIGIVYDPSDDFSMTVGGGYANREERTTDETGDRSTDTTPGIALRFLANYETDYLDFNLSTRYTTAAPTSRFSGDFQLAYELPRGQLTARAYQNYGLGSEGDDRRVTGIGLGYSLAVNQVSTLLFDFNAANSASADDDTEDPDRSRLDFTAQYTRELHRRRRRLGRLHPDPELRGSGRRHQQPLLLPDRPELRDRLLSTLRPRRSGQPQPAAEAGDAAAEPARQAAGLQRLGVEHHPALVVEDRLAGRATGDLAGLPALALDEEPRRQGRRHRPPP